MTATVSAAQQWVINRGNTGVRLARQNFCSDASSSYSQYIFFFDNSNVQISDCPFFNRTLHYWSKNVTKSIQPSHIFSSRLLSGPGRLMGGSERLELSDITIFGNQEQKWVLWPSQGISTTCNFTRQVPRVPL
jgi:hypothetical protein